jgi:hypothetical protein
MKKLISILILALVSTLTLAADPPCEKTPWYKLQPGGWTLDGGPVLYGEQNGHPRMKGLDLGVGKRLSDALHARVLVSVLEIDATPATTIHLPREYDDFRLNSRPAEIVVPGIDEHTVTGIRLMFSYNLD